ncbi:MAG TPA: response regulator transcription factor [Aggregatilineales bacterium]|nr:response regulator transcription factor [Anaerolineae bacterium]HUN07410.1 response regulator transcription factor [Aggregatilineales bacterium]
MDKITILIVDDNVGFRSGLRALLDSAPEAMVVGEAGSGAEAITLAASLQPDVILMDIQMATMNGIEATRRILHTSPHIAILVLTMFEDDDFVFSAMRAGARGYLLKGTMKADLLRAVQSVSSGEAIFGASIARRLMNYFAERQHLPASTQVSFPELTEREREILHLMASHQSNGEIAEQLHISLKTVRNHVSNIFSKLQVVDRTQAILRAKGAGLGDESHY